MTAMLALTTSTISQPWNVNVRIDASGVSSKSMGLVQKCGGSATGEQANEAKR